MPTQTRVRCLAAVLAACLCVPEGAALAKPSPGDAERQFRAGVAAYDEHRNAEAILYLDAALKLRPNWPQALNMKGAALAFSGKRKEGERLIREAIRLKPDYENAYFNLGLAMELQKRYADAIQAYDQALKLVPSNAWSWYGKACAAAGMRDARLAASHLQQAIRLNSACRREALTEKDFDPVRRAPVFQAVLRAAPAKGSSGRRSAR